MRTCMKLWGNEDRTSGASVVFLRASWCGLRPVLPSSDYPALCCGAPPSPAPLRAPLSACLQTRRENSNALPPFWEGRIRSSGALTYVSQLTNFISTERPAPLR